MMETPGFPKYRAVFNILTDFFFFLCVHYSKVSVLQHSCNTFMVQNHFLIIIMLDPLSILYLKNVKLKKQIS